MPSRDLHHRSVVADTHNDNFRPEGALRERIPSLHRLGVRIASLAHWGRTPLADGSGEDATGSRPTGAGVEALAELERLGILFDVSHLSASGVAHVLELATHPVLATHSSARALRDHHRNLTDAQIPGIAATVPGVKVPLEEVDVQPGIDEARGSDPPAQVPSSRHSLSCDG